MNDHPGSNDYSIPRSNDIVWELTVGFYQGWHEPLAWRASRIDARNLLRLLHEPPKDEDV